MIPVALSTFQPFVTDEMLIVTSDKSPNHALQRTATLAFSCRCAAVGSTGSVTGHAYHLRPRMSRAFASRRLAATRASGSRSLSLGSLIWLSCLQEVNRVFHYFLFSNAAGCFGNRGRGSGAAVHGGC